MVRWTMIAAALAVGPVAAEQVAPQAVSYDEYGAVAEALSDQPGDPLAGQEVMVTSGAGNCIACHQVSALDEFPFHGDVGPSLDGVASRWQEAELRGIVANAKHVFPGTIMPAFYKTEDFVRPGDEYTGKAAEGELEPLLTGQQIEDVVAYLVTLTE